MSRGRVALVGSCGYGVFLGLVLFLSAPWSVRVKLPIYGHDTLHMSSMSAIVIMLGVLVAAGCAYLAAGSARIFAVAIRSDREQAAVGVRAAGGVSRGLWGRFLAGMIAGSLAPLVTGTPVALVISAVTLAGAIWTFVLLSRDEAARAQTGTGPIR